MGLADRSMSFRQTSSSSSEGNEQDQNEDDDQQQQEQQNGQDQTAEESNLLGTVTADVLNTASGINSVFSSLAEAQQAIGALALQVSQGGGGGGDQNHQDGEDEDELDEENLNHYLSDIDGQFNSINAILSVLDAQSDSLRDRVTDLLKEIRSDRHSGGGGGGRQNGNGGDLPQ